MGKNKGGINPVFFLDRTHGKRTSKVLQSVGMKVVLHDSWFLRETPDPEWIARCGQEEWAILSGDKSIELVPENKQAVIDAKVRVFFFNDTNSLPEEWAAAVIMGRPKLFEIIERNNGPFFVTIEKYARSHISTVRFVGDGGPKPSEVEANAEGMPASPQPKPEAVAPRAPIQGELFKRKGT